MPTNTITHNEIILIVDPKILAIPIIDNAEKLIDIKTQSRISYGESPEIPNNQDYTYLRKTVYDKLVTAQDLLPQGLFFCLYEGYRSMSLQKLLFDTRYQKIKDKNPSWTKEEIFAETIRLVSPVINLDGSPNIPPHATGAAIDVYLIDENNEAVEMGIHPKDWMKDEKGELSLTSSTTISPLANKNRKIMSQVLAAVGFCNYPTEYWHWSYGDRYWAFHANNKYAIYDKIER